MKKFYLTIALILCTLTVSQAVNMWGNVWEWTSISRENETKAIKYGGKNSCEYYNKIACGRINYIMRSS